MSEIWNNDSEIEEKNSFFVSPQIYQLKSYFDIRDFDNVLKKMYNNQSLEESDYLIVGSFLNSDYKEKYNERYEELVKYAPADLKKKYTINKIKNLKVNNTDEEFISNLFSGNINSGQKDTAYYLLYNDNHFMDDKLVDDKVKETLKSVMTPEFIDKMHNSFLNRMKKNPLYGKELMDNNLKNEIISSIPNEYSKLEQCIYLYIKLCQMLSYDNSYYVNRNAFYRKHADFSNIGEITSENPGVVCYEFVSLYSELLEKFGIKANVSTSFASDYDENGNIYVDSFDDKHAYLDFNVDNFIIRADSTTSVLCGDLINVKMGNKLNGLKCNNVDELDKLVFDSSLEKVYSNFTKNTEFKNYVNDNMELPLNEKLKQLFNDISNMDVQGVDFISYITNLKHKYFSKDELQWNIAINYVGKNDGISQYPVVIFSVNTNDIINVPSDTVQYLYDTKNHQITKYDNQELSELFDSELFRLDETKNIPGISNNIKK